MLFYFSPWDLLKIRNKYNFGLFLQNKRGLPDTEHTLTWVSDTSIDAELLNSASRLRYSDQITDCRNEKKIFTSKIRELIFG